MNYISGKTRSSTFRYTGNPFQIKLYKTNSKAIAKEEWNLDSILDGLDTEKNLERTIKSGETLATDNSTAAALGKKEKLTRKRKLDQKLPSGRGDIEEGSEEENLFLCSGTGDSLEAISDIPDSIRRKDIFDFLVGKRAKECQD